jgi:hypothetical protein
MKKSLFNQQSHRLITRSSHPQWSQATVPLIRPFGFVDRRGDDPRPGAAEASPATLHSRPCGGPDTHDRSALSFPRGIAKLFTDQVVPSGGVSGAILVARGLVRRGVPTNIAMAVLLVGLVAYFGAYLASVLASLGILWLYAVPTP